LITVKMMGDADALAAEQERLIKFCEDLRIRSADRSADRGADSK